MTDAKIIDFKSHQKLRERLQKEGAEAIINERRAALRQLEEDVQDLLFTPHKLIEAQPLKDKTIRQEYNLTRIIDWLEGKTIEAASEEQKAAAQAMIKQCEQLIARNERIKKNIADDISTCRYVEGKEALDPIKVVGFLTGTPLGFATLTKTFITDKPEAIWHAGELGAVLGVCLAFHRQAKGLCKATGKAISNSPKRIKHWGKAARSFAFATALTTSVATKQISDIEPICPRENASRTRIIGVARKLAI
jgi:hypothetical protein